MVQQMPEFDAGRIDVDPEQREDDWRKAVILMASATEAEMLDPETAGRRTACGACSTPSSCACSSAGCSTPAAAAAASASTACCARLKREELSDLRDPSGRVVVKCEFCSTEYGYDDGDLDRIYASAA